MTTPTPDAEPYTEAEWDQLARIHRELIHACLLVLAGGGTYCYQHGYDQNGCSACGWLGFPDLSQYRDRARATLEGGR